MDKKIFIIVLVYLAQAAQGLDESNITVGELDQVFYRFSSIEAELAPGETPCKPGGWYSGKPGGKPCTGGKAVVTRTQYYDIKNKTVDEIAEEIKRRGFIHGRETKIYIPGYTQSATQFSKYFTNAYLAAKTKNVNLFVVDWSQTAKNPRYSHALRSVDEVGKRICKHLLRGILKAKAQHGNIHIIGHGLGALVSGYAVKCLTKKDAKKIVKIGRITALDPDARGKFISKKYAEFVDVIHTNGGDLSEGCIGSPHQLGHADFFPNQHIESPPKGFNDQHVPGCNDKKYTSQDDLAKNYDINKACSHDVALTLYHQSLTYYPPRYDSRRCKQWHVKRNSGNKVVSRTCVKAEDDQFYLGEFLNVTKVLSLSGDTRFFLTTTEGKYRRYFQSDFKLS